MTTNKLLPKYFTNFLPIDSAIAFDFRCVQVFSSGNCNARGNFDPSLGALIAYKHDLARDSSLAEQLLGVSCLDKWKSLRDQRLDLSLLKEVEEDDQILAKPSWF